MTSGSHRPSPSPSPSIPEKAGQGSLRFFDRSPASTNARKTYLKIFFGGTFSIIIMVFSILPIYWGALWKIPAHNVEGWVVDFDGGVIGQNVLEGLVSNQGNSRVTWTAQPAERFNGQPENLALDVREEQTWVAIAILPGVSAQLTSALSAPNASYDGSRSIVVYGVEARNENAYRSIIRPSAEGVLAVITRQIALRTATQAATLPNLQAIVQTSPQTLVAPISYSINNLVPFDQPVATASTFVGMLYQLIMGFFVVMVSMGAREASGYDRKLSTRRLILLRLSSSFLAYFFISLFYSLLNMAFQLDVSRKYGHSGFLVFWMVNYVGMLAVCLALESLITILTVRGIPFFMLLWIISNLSVCIFPLEVLPKVFHYGYGAPFYNLSRALRTIVFGTRNTVGRSVGILLAWVALSCITLTFFQWFVRRGAKTPPEMESIEDQVESTHIDSVGEKRLQQSA